MNWTTVYPTKPGRYWFYGWTDRVHSKKNNLPPRMKPIEAVRSGDGKIICHTDGGFLFENTALGLWLPMEAPEPPATDLFK